MQRKPSEREIKMASSLVDGLHAEFDPTAYEDSYREAVLKVVKAKAAGKNIEPPADEEPEPPTTCWPRSRRAWRTPDAALALDRLARASGSSTSPSRCSAASRDTDLHFRQLHAKDHTPVEIHRFCAEEDVEVPYEEIANGYETDDDDWWSSPTPSSPPPRRARRARSTSRRSSTLEDVDPIYFDHPYVLMPAGDADGTAARLPPAGRGDGPHRARRARPLRPAHQGVPRADPRPRASRLVLTTLRWHDEVRPTKDIPTPTKQDKPAKKEVDGAVALIEALACPWDPSRYEDRYQKRLKKIVRDKSKGKTIEVPEEEKEPCARPRPHGRARGDPGRDHVTLRDSAHR